MRRFGTLLTLPLVALVLAPVAADDDLPIRPPGRPGAPPAAPAASALSDEEALQKAGLSPTDPEPLLEYLKARTLTEVDQNKIGDVIKRFADDDFDTRVKATEEVERFGPAAIGPLKAAERSTDPEVAYRAKVALRRMEKVPHTAVATAAVRAVVRLKPKDGAAVLLGFLPMADTEEVADEIRAALVGLAVVGGKTEPALLAALDDKLVIRRTAAYLALIEGGDPKQRVRIKDAYPKVTAAVRAEADPDAKFRGLWALLMTGRAKEFVPDLIDLIPKLQRGRIWQLEELLLQLAGADKPADAKFGKGEEGLNKAKAAWAAWWDKKGAALDLAKFEYSPRTTGHTDIIEYDYSGFGRYRVVTLGPDMKVKATLGGTGVNQLNYPSEVRKLPGGNYVVAEMNSGRVTERDSTGRVLNTTNVPIPVSFDLLPDGGMVVVCRNQVVQYDKKGTQVWAYQRPQYDIMAGRRLPGGDVVFVTNMFQGANCYRLTTKDKDGKETKEVREAGKPYQLGRIQSYQSIDATGDEKIMVCEFNRVVEYDLKDREKAKELWSYNSPNATSCQRLPNGNTLITQINHTPNGRVIEVDPSGDIVWEHSSPDGLRCARAYRR
jgi:hypothetical protein